jgi:molybdopterin synthase catalytic subunit
MALAQFARIAGVLRAEHGVRHVAIDHRRGAVDVGGLSVAIAVAAPRRTSALAACAAAIEALKRDVPIWKREAFADGTHRWVQGS